MINPNLDLEALAKSYQVNKSLKIENFMQPEIAERMRDACLSHVPFNVQYVVDDNYQSKTPQEVASLNPQQAQHINSKVSSAASQGVGFLYEGYASTRAKTETNKSINPELTFLHTIFDYLGSEEVLNLITKITSDHKVTGADSQYTRFTPGHFLTRHLDVMPGRGRKFAFVLGLTKDWHPDWGGLLQFYEQDGTPLESWMPQFNVLSIFDVSHIHAVTYVTPYALAPRLSLAGWFVHRD